MPRVPFARAAFLVATHGSQGLARSKLLWGSSLIGVFAVALAFVLHAVANTASFRWETFALTFLASIVSPLIALLLGTWAMGAEREGGTLVFTYSRPLRRSAMLAGRALAANAAAVGTVVIVALLSWVGYGAGQANVPGALVALGLETMAFTTLFVLLGTLMARALYVGLAYAVLIEGALGGVVTLQGGLTLGQHARNILERWSATKPIPPMELAQSDVVSVVVLLVATLVFLAIAMVWIETRETSGRDRVKGE